MGIWSYPKHSNLTTPLLILIGNDGALAVTLPDPRSTSPAILVVLLIDRFSVVPDSVCGLERAPE